VNYVVIHSNIYYAESESKKKGEEASKAAIARP
jgi:hypothetical protein